MSKEKVNSESVSLGSLLTFEELGFQPKDKAVSDKAFAQYIRALMQNWRQGTVAVKGRSDVSLTNKKPFKQKGTGRARAGSARSPLWRGGGIVFGPQQRVKQLKVTKEVRQSVLAQLLQDYINANRVIVADWAIDGELPKTNLAHALLKKLNLVGKKVVLLLSHDDLITYASFINVPYVQVLLFDQLNAYDLAHADYWMMLKKDKEAFKEVVTQWN